MTIIAGIRHGFAHAALAQEMMTMNTEDNATPDNATPSADKPVWADIRHLSPLEFARLGVSQIANIKPVVVQGAPAFAIHGADGAPLAVTPDRDLALAAIVQHEMVPISLH